MSFTFNFAGEDIEPDVDEAPGNSDDAAGAASANGAPQADADALPPNVPVVRHDIKEWLSQLPSQLSYDAIALTLPNSSNDTVPLLLPRRSLFDIRAQLISEDSPSLTHLSSASDLDRHIYEGGYKTWESSLDLSRLLLGQLNSDGTSTTGMPHTVVELGCGSALPSLVLFRHALKEASQSTPTRFVLADYNAEVLRLVTLPNMLLTWALTVRADGAVCAQGGEVDVDEALVEEFLAVLGAREVRLLSGPWGEELRREMGRDQESGDTLVLAAETIYSPTSLAGFVGMLRGLLGAQGSRAYVAAKRFYFGVGGSVDALKQACGDAGLVAREVRDHGMAEMDEGVGRAVVEVRSGQ